LAGLSVDTTTNISYNALSATSPIIKENDMEMYISEFDGNKVAYTDCTEFLIQVGKGKGSYKTTMKFTGKLISAVTYYRAINLGNGHKKRLLMPSCSKKPVLARHFS
jgi:hypothetical protein